MNNDKSRPKNRLLLFYSSFNGDFSHSLNACWASFLNKGFMGNFLFVGLIVVIVAGLANMFFQIPALHLAINAAVVMIMSGLILFDTSRFFNGGETNYIRATVSLYLNVFNIFVHLLSLLGIMGGDD